MAVRNITKLKHRFPLKQIRRSLKWSFQFWPVFALTAITLILCFLNYEPNTILSGWDNLHPELNPAMNLRRAFFAVWQEYQSLGLLGGMAHAADLPKVILVYLFSLIGFPMLFFRYFWTFLMLLIGPLGVYTFLNHHLLGKHFDTKSTDMGSFLGGLFYLLNLATIQTFFTPFDTFTSFYGFFPWLIYFAISYLNKPTLKKAGFIFIFSFLSSPSFYTETLFVVFGFCLLPLLLEYILSHKHPNKFFILPAKTIALFIVPSLFWLLPTAFFVLTNGSVGQLAKMNTIATPETYARNLQFGNLVDLSLLKGFWFNYLDFVSTNKFDYLMLVWRNHLNVFSVSLIGYLIFAIILTGLYYTIKKNLAWGKSILAMLFICLFFLLGGGLVVNNVIPLIGELFRSPFTKFSIPLSFTYACFFAIGSLFILDLFTFLHSRLTYIITLFTITLSVLIFTSPAFSGNFISPSMRIKIPEEYFNVINFFKIQDQSTRIANFPQHTFWGWNYNSWGYRGSGFLWYGIRQPILDRAFDVWDLSGQDYYEEISQAIYSEDQVQFEKVVDKYAVNWLLLDHSIIAPDGKIDLGMNKLQKLIDNSGKFSKVQDFGNVISLYKTDMDKKSKNFLSLTPLNAGTITPFANLSQRPNTDWVYKNDLLSLTSPLIGKPGDVFHVPSLNDSEKYLSVSIDYQKIGGNIILRLTPQTPIIFLNTSQLDLKVRPTLITIPAGSAASGFILRLGEQFYELALPSEIIEFTTFYPLTTASIPSTASFPVAIYDSNPQNTQNLDQALSQAQAYRCYVDKPNRKVEQITARNTISLLGTDVVGCLSTPLPYIPSGTLISYAYTYSSPTLTTANVNVTGKDLSGQTIPQSLEPEKEPHRVRQFTISQGNEQQLNLILEASETKNTQEIDYENIEVATHPLIFQTTVSLDHLAPLDIPLKGEANRIQISLPVSNTQFDTVQTPESNSLFPENRNCDQFNDGFTAKKVDEKGFTYQSKNAIECDYLSLRHLPHSINYLLSFNYQSGFGLKPTICLENHTTKRCDIFERLLPTTQTQSIIQPIANPNEYPGFTLHIFNNSFGNSLTQNIIKSFSVHPIPLNFLKNIQLTTPTSDTATSPTTSSTHPYEFFYTATVNSTEPASLALYQAKSSSWKAVVVSSKDVKMAPWLLSAILPITYPFLTKLPHNDSGLWYNSFAVPAGETNVLLVYLPQYLEFFGLTVLFFVILVIAIFSLKHIIKKFPRLKPKTKK